MELKENARSRVYERWITGRQSYFLEVPSARNAAQLSVVSFTAIERMGAANEVRINLTHPGQLSRQDYLSRDAVFVIETTDGVTRRFSGFIDSFAKLGTSRDASSYEFVLRSHLARLAAVRTSRIYQHQSTPQIIETILRRHGLEGHQFDFRLRCQYPQHLFRFQYCLDDLSYVQMLAQKAGIYFYTLQTEFGDQIVFGDDIDQYIYEPPLSVPYHETAGLESDTESVFEIAIRAHTVPQSIKVADYNPEKAWERFIDEANAAPEDPTTYGQPYAFGTHHLDQAGAKWEAQLRHEAEIAWQVVFDAGSNISLLQPGRVLHVDTELEDASDGLLVAEVMHSGARDAAYSNIFKAIPADRRFRLKLEEDEWPKIAGSLSARITTPDRYKYAYLSAAGYYTVRLDLDFEDWPAGGESVPMRLAKPFAGSLQTGFHFPAIHNAEAAIEFRDGDPDKPYIAAFHHHSQAVDLVTSDRRWLSRNAIRTQSNNKLRMEDWQGQEGIKLSTEHSGKSQLNLGYLVDSKLERRGEGFELRTSGYGAVRSGKGLFISADDQPNAAGQQLDMREAVAQIESALEMARALADSASAAKAWPADIDAQKQLGDELDELKKPGMLAHAPASVGVVSDRGVQITAQQNISAVAGKNVDISVMKRFTASAVDAISVFAQKCGIKLFAASGPVDIQAQGDHMSLVSDKDLTISSVNGVVRISANKELTLESGGAFVKLANGSITLGGPLDLFLKTITIQKKGAASLNTPMPALPYPKPGATDLEFRRVYVDGSPIAGSRYVASLDDGTTRSGTLDAGGYARLTDLPTGTGARIRYLDDPNPHRSTITTEHDSDLIDVMPAAGAKEQQ